jgi:hypothetical protein
MSVTSFLPITWLSERLTSSVARPWVHGSKIPDNRHT